MPPIFKPEDFEFANPEDMPYHTNGIPLGQLRDLGKYALLVEVVGASFYLAAMNIDDRETTEVLSDAFLARIATKREENEANAKRPEARHALNNQYVMHIISPRRIKKSK